jgi:Flp pilus assembly pilin Flp
MMNRIWIRFRYETIRFWRETDGQDLVEYALIVAAIALGMIAAVRGLSLALSSLYESITTGLTTVGT